MSLMTTADSVTFVLCFVFVYSFAVSVLVFC